MARLGLPRYAADDLAGIKSELRAGAGFALVHDLIEDFGGSGETDAAGARLLRLWLDADWLPDPPAAHSGRRNPMAAIL